MHYNRISAIYYSFLQSHEYDENFKNIEFDISWLEQKLEISDILKLEELIMSYNLQTYQTTFECGFTYAWELFYECQERKIQNEQ
ncbi:hypothetical protein SAMN02745136_04542 [Anaerocolumna jejuensis DSM 15929]|uniref:Uncharacterized protein n=1 Tax=Anaerocolumna jejuensis DSM 15929 TaxID=1121322 RepID=A0A1M6ZBR6_9FIRM|nr:hypothetical protein [Anaerocolumna jejuensis]SHL27912.1 hypothetical protein SAMN02745136_04542 [Anaerocolumna jejuensis DSM 15929]